jgi:hypothetical protein
MTSGGQEILQMLKIANTGSSFYANFVCRFILN